MNNFIYDVIANLDIWFLFSRKFTNHIISKPPEQSGTSELNEMWGGSVKYLIYI